MGGVTEESLAGSGVTRRASDSPQDLLEADKTYLATVHLGVRTDTGDTEGQVLETMPVDVTVERIEAVLATFRGPIAQVPPM